MGLARYVALLSVLLLAAACQSQPRHALEFCQPPFDTDISAHASGDVRSDGTGAFEKETAVACSYEDVSLSVSPTYKRKVSNPSRPTVFENTRQEVQYVDEVIRTDVELENVPVCPYWWCPTLSGTTPGSAGHRRRTTIPKYRN